MRKERTIIINASNTLTQAHSVTTRRRHITLQHNPDATKQALTTEELNTRYDHN